MNPSLESAITTVELGLAALAEAVQDHDGPGIDRSAADLQRALGAALDEFRRHRAPLSPALRQRLARASAQVAAQRDSLGRASSSLDRAIAGLLPREAGVYNARGSAEQARHSGVARA